MRGAGQANPDFCPMSLPLTTLISFVSPAVLAGDDPAANPCLDCGACCAHFRVSFYIGELAGENGGQVPLDVEPVLGRELGLERLEVNGRGQWGAGRLDRPPGLGGGHRLLGCRLLSVFACGAGQARTSRPRRTAQHCTRPTPRKRAGASVARRPRPARAARSGDTSRKRTGARLAVPRSG